MTDIKGSFIGYVMPKRFVCSYIVLAVVLFPVFILCGCGSKFDVLLDEKSTQVPVVYWCEISGTFNRIGVDGTGNSVLFTIPYIPFDIALHSFNGKIFRTELTENYYQIIMSDLSGSNETMIYRYSALKGVGPMAIGLDSFSNMIFWSQRSSSSKITDVWTLELSSIPFSPEKWDNDLAVPYIYAICTDPINNRLYFTANTFYDNGIYNGSGNTGAVFSCKLDTPNVFLDEISGNGLSDTAIPYKGIAVDGAAGYIYYVKDTGTQGIIRCDLSLQNHEVWVSASGFDMQKIALDLINRKIYWTSETDNSIYRADLDIPNSDIEKFLELHSRPTGITISQ